MRRPGIGVALALLALAAAGCEGDRNRYATLADARKAGAVERGWVPAWVPGGATVIEEAHDLDGNRRRLRFQATADEVEALADGLPRLHVSAICASRGIPAIAGEWPPALEAGEAAWAFTYRVAESRGGARLAVAIHRSSATVYAWSCPAK